MIGSSRRDEAIGALQAEAEASRNQISALMAQLAALAARVEAGFEQQAAAAGQWTAMGAKLEGRLDRLEERIDRTEVAYGARLDAQARTAQGQASALTALEGADERHAEALRQLRADIARLGLQAASDLAELRAADTALAGLMATRSPARPGEKTGPASETA